MEGHGHVKPRPDGMKARCGGPALCDVCAKEAGYKSSDEWLAAYLAREAEEVVKKGPSDNGK